MTVYVTGDIHGGLDMQKLRDWDLGESLTSDDYLIIAGDFGFPWDFSAEECADIAWLESRPYTVLFVDGNHERFDHWAERPMELWHGGLTQRLSDTSPIRRLTRGEVFELDGSTIFTMGGARRHDIVNGVLNPKAPDFEEQYWALRRMGARFRVNHRSWWKQELPSKTEYEEAQRSLERIHYEMDYVITHCAPNSIVDILGNGGYVPVSYTHLTLPTTPYV